MKKTLVVWVATGAFALATAVGMGGCASSKPENQRNAGEFTDDAAITAKVKSAIASDVGARTASSVNVETYKGIVQLSGFVDTQDQAQRAIVAAQKVGGVKSVKNDLRLKS